MKTTAKIATSVFASLTTATIAFMLASTSAYGAVQMRYDGVLPRNIATAQYFDVEVRILNMQQDRFNMDEIFKRITFFLDYEQLPGGGEIKELPTNSPNFTVQQIVPPIFTIDPQTLNYNVTLSLRVLRGQMSFAQLLEWGDGKIFVRINYVDGDLSQNQTVLGDKVTLERAMYIANQAPEFSALGSPNRIDLSWPNLGQILYSDGERREHAGVVAVAIEQGLGDLALAGYRFVPDAEDGEDVPGTFCEYLDLMDDGECMRCNGEGDGAFYYLDVAKLKDRKEEGIHVVSKGTASQRGPISGLDPDKTYNVFMYYQPESATISSCRAVSPVLSLTVSQLNGEENVELSALHCFVATATFGSPFHPAVKLLRSFRDRILLKFAWGRDFVRTYYQLSPPLAALIADSLALKVLALGALTPVMAGAAIILLLAHPSTATAMFFLAFLASMAYLVRRRIRSGS